MPYESQKKYMKEHTLSVHVTLNTDHESDIIHRLAAVNSRQQYVKRLIAAYAAKPFDLPVFDKPIAKAKQSSQSFTFALVDSTDADLIACIESNRPASAFIKRLIRADMQRAENVSPADAPKTVKPPRDFVPTDVLTADDLIALLKTVPADTPLIVVHDDEQETTSEIIRVTTGPMIGLYIDD